MVSAPPRKLLFTSSLPIKAAGDRQQAIIELIVRANWQAQAIGHFAMDFDDGEIIFRTGMDFTDCLPAPEHIRRLVQLNLRSVDRYLPAFFQVLYGKAEPQEAMAALAAIERGKLFPLANPD